MGKKIVIGKIQLFQLYLKIQYFGETVKLEQLWNKLAMLYLKI